MRLDCSYNFNRLLFREHSIHNNGICFYVAGTRGLYCDIRFEMVKRMVGRRWAMMAKVNQDPFSNGEEFRNWIERNCDKCYKSPKTIIDDLLVYTKCRCAIYRDINVRMFSDRPIAQRSIDACQKNDCPYRQEHWKQYKRKHKSKTAGLPTLFN